MNRRKLIPLAALVAAFSGISHNAVADLAAAERWVRDEFQPSTLAESDQLQEMEWFISAAEPFEGMEINVVSETIADTRVRGQGIGRRVLRNYRHPREP